MTRQGGRRDSIAVVTASPPLRPRFPGPRSVTVRVPAKVNLHLSVGDVRKDGKHEIVTVYQAVSLYDEVTVEPDDRLSVSVAGVVLEEVDRLAYVAVGLRPRLGALAHRQGRGLQAPLAQPRRRAHQDLGALLGGRRGPLAEPAPGDRERGV